MAPRDAREARPPRPQVRPPRLRPRVLPRHLRSPSRKGCRLLEQGVWKVNGSYYGISSGQTGRAPNQAAYLTSTGSITGPWNNSLTGVGTNGSTWSSQPTYVIPIVGSQTTTYIYASDIWNSSNLSLSTYLWLPFTFDGTKWSLSYSAQWSINLVTGVVSTN